MVLDGKAVIHIVDTASRFSAETFLESSGATMENQLKVYGLISSWLCVRSTPTSLIDFEATKDPYVRVQDRNIWRI